MVSNTVELKQKSLLCDRKGERANVTPPTQEAPLMRLSVASLRRMIKGKLSVEFVHQDLTSYSGLELLRCYLRQLDLARRLEHLRYLAGDPLIPRFAGLTRVPTARTVGNWLRQFTPPTLAPLVQLNHA